MGIVKVHGIHATRISLDDRFSMLAAAAPDRPPVWQKRRPIGAFMNANFNFRNRNFLEQIAEKLDDRSKREAIKQRLGFGSGGLRRFGSEGNLSGLRRANSFGSLNQDRNIRERIGWRQSNGNLSRSASFDNLSRASWGGRSLRGFRRRGGGQRAVRGRFRGGRQGPGRVTRLPHRVFTRGNGWTQGPQRQNRGAARGVGRGVARGAGGANTGGGANRGAGRGRGRGGILRTQPTKPLMTKEELDKQLDQYMAGCKDALDKELDLYMKNAMDLE